MLCRYSRKDPIVFSLNFSLAGVLITGVIQAIVFGLIHRKSAKKYLPRHILLGLIWFVAGYFGGIVPAIVGHTVATLTFRFRARYHHGWYDKD